MTEEAAAVIRCSKEGDVEGILAIYAPIVRETAISFEVEPPSMEEMHRRIESTVIRLPWLIYDVDGRVGGYAYAGRHRERAAYQWSVDVSVYVAEELRGKGLGRKLYEPLLGILEDLGYYTALAGIALPNAASVGLHEAMGFRPIGVYRNVGYKLGKWHDVGWWQRQLRELGSDPQAPIGIGEYAASGALERRLRGQQ
ncbi:MAG: arsinothricin resistance N-acetyltransferase ArsN1 family B [Anaerolineae bacterium]